VSLTPTMWSGLQADLTSIYDWAKTNNMLFNSEKFECLRYGPNKILKETTEYLSENQIPINQSSKVRDLGVQMSPDACFSLHISDTVLAASQKCGWILRSFKTRDCSLMITLWKSLVAPILDYCSQLWCPVNLGQIQKLELIQLHYFNKISGMAALDYWQQLRTLNMLSLQRRRERYICIYIWKILEGTVPNFGIEVSCSKRRGRSCIVPALGRAAPHKIQTIRFNSMGIHGPIIFNCLPQKLRDMSSCSTDCFKRALDKHLSTVPDEPRVPRLIKYCSKSSNSLIEY